MYGRASFIHTDVCGRAKSPDNMHKAVALSVSRNEAALDETGSSQQQSNDAAQQLIPQKKYSTASIECSMDAGRPLTE